jgi:mono/diheme cytochrome c family protein
MIGDPNPKRPLTDRQRAFKKYKEGVASHGKPFFPDGVWHDVIAGTVAIAIVILLSIVWFTDANCGTPFEFGCKDAKTHKALVATPGEQAGTLKRRNTGESGDKPILGPLYEEKADPGTTSYDPRPEWYFFFLFELLRIFSNPQTVILGTIIVPTIALVLLLAWPFLDRQRERRPSRRPIAMSGMVITAITLLSLTYIGSKAGQQEGGPKGLTPAQKKMPGYKLIFDDSRALCLSCHKFNNVGASGPGPDLSKEGTIAKHDLEWQQRHLHKPTSETPGSSMPPQSPTFTDKELAEISGFLETLGNDARASDPKYVEPKVESE